MFWLVWFTWSCCALDRVVNWFSECFWLRCRVSCCVRLSVSQISLKATRENFATVLFVFVVFRSDFVLVVCLFLFCAPKQPVRGVSTKPWIKPQQYIKLNGVGLRATVAIQAMTKPMPWPVLLSTTYKRLLRIKKFSAKRGYLHETSGIRYGNHRP